MNTRPPEWETKQYINVYDCKEVKLWELFYEKLNFVSQNDSQMEKQDFINDYNDWKMKKTFLWKHLLKLHKELRVFYESHKNELERDKMDTDSIENWIVTRDRMMDDMEKTLIYTDKTYLTHLQLLKLNEELKKEERIDDLKLLEYKEESRNMKEYIKIEGKTE